MKAYRNLAKFQGAMDISIHILILLNHLFPATIAKILKLFDGSFIFMDKFHLSKAAQLFQEDRSLLTIEYPGVSDTQLINL